jgi:hypothetical protein
MGEGKDENVTVVGTGEWGAESHIGKCSSVKDVLTMF